MVRPQIAERRGHQAPGGRHRRGKEREADEECLLASAWPQQARLRRNYFHLTPCRRSIHERDRRPLGWALDHQIGLALNNKQNLPPGTADTENLPEYLAESCYGIYKPSGTVERIERFLVLSLAG